MGILLPVGTACCDVAALLSVSGIVFLLISSENRTRTTSSLRRSSDPATGAVVVFQVAEREGGGRACPEVGARSSAALLVSAGTSFTPSS